MSFSHNFAKIVFLLLCEASALAIIWSAVAIRINLNKISLSPMPNYSYGPVDMVWHKYEIHEAVQYVSLYVLSGPVHLPAPKYSGAS